MLRPRCVLMPSHVASLAVSRGHFGDARRRRRRPVWFRIGGFRMPLAGGEMRRRTYRGTGDAGRAAGRPRVAATARSSSPAVLRTVAPSRPVDAKR